MNGAKRSEGLSIFAAIAFAVGNMVGAGVFVLSGLMINRAGPAASLSYFICGVLVVFSGLSYAALASIFPEDGGGYLYARHMLGKYLGFIAGWSMYISEIVVHWSSVKDIWDRHIMVYSFLYLAFFHLKFSFI
jgi:APA family basic amino acid/polyamine antiporter